LERRGHGMAVAGLAVLHWPGRRHSSVPPGSDETDETDEARSEQAGAEGGVRRVTCWT
jgi:hypothetical protein